MIKTDRNIRDSYKTYKKFTENPVDIKTYISLANNYNKFLAEHVAEGYEVVLPMRMGTLAIIGTKIKIKFDDNGNPALPVNWPATIRMWNKKPETKEQDKKIYFTNDHSDGIRYKYFWSKKRIFATQKNLYTLRMTRENKRRVPELVSQGKEYYVKS
jgi:hypothetical protein